MNEKEKTTVPIPSVGADGEQSLSYVTNEIIATGNEEINPIDESMEEMLRQMQRMSDPSYLATMTMSQLYDTVYESRLPIIDGLLYPGTYLFVGAPKVGKSFLMAQIAYHVSTGQALWNYPVHAGTVLYLALEDDYRRLQERLFRMFGVGLVKPFKSSTATTNGQICNLPFTALFSRVYTSLTLSVWTTVRKPVCEHSK